MTDIQGFYLPPNPIPFTSTKGSILADVIFAGGTEAAITNLSLASFGNAKALSTRNEEASLASRPFDANRDGFVMSEGAGILVLESLEHAVQRNAPIFGEVIGCGASSDAYHMVATHPEGQGAYLAILPF